MKKSSSSTSPPKLPERLHRLSLKNFQIHRSLILDLDTGLATIVGDNAAGKSTILRALRFVCLGEWDPGYVTHGEPETLVSLEFDENKIQRRKGKKTNLLRLNGKVFKAFGNRVPEEIANKLNLSEYNFQRQFDPHFWFSDTAGEVARQLNAIVNLQVIDEIQVNVASDIRKTKIEIEVIQKRFNEAEEEVTSLSWVPEFKKQVDKLTALQDKAKALRLRRDRLQVLLQTATHHRQALKTAKELSVAGSRAVAAGDKWQQVKTKRDRLQNYLDLLRVNRKSMVKPVDLTGLEKSYQAKQAAILKRSRLAELSVQLQERWDLLCRLKQKLQELTKKLAEQKVCPTCNRPFQSPSSAQTCTSVTHPQPAGLKKGMSGIT